MIKAIIFDCFGVLVTENWFALKEKYFGNDTEQAGQATDLMRQADAGLITHTDLLQQLAEMSGVSSADILRQLNENTPNGPLLDYIARELKPYYKIGLLSNASGNRLQELFSEAQRALFDVTALSFESGVAKPDERAYVQVAAQLAVEPEECVFIDDQERHCSGAQAVGMQAIEFKDLAQFKRELAAMLKVDA